MKTAALCRLLTVAGGLLAATFGSALSQSYPSKTVRIVVPFSAGGPNDILARLLAQQLTEAWKHPVIVDNRPGGGTVIGTELAVKSPADGYTLLMVSTSHTANPSLRKLPYDALRDIEPIILVASGPNVVLTHPSVPARSVKQLIALARARPGEVTYGSGGAGTSTHLTGAMLALAGGVKMIHVPYKGGGPATTALMSGEITWITGTILPSMPPIRSGRLRALAVTGRKRTPVLPEVPTVAESVPGVESESWYGLGAPGGTPKEIVARINETLVPRLKSIAMRERLATEGAEVIASGPEEFARFYRAEIEKWGRVIRAAGIRLE